MSTHNETKHTPGPWSANGLRVSSSDGTQLAAVLKYAYPSPIGEDIANARLMASAPELLAALKLAIPILERARSGMISPHALAEVESALLASRSAYDKSEARP